MTQNQTLKLIRDLGFSARVTDGEWRINTRRGSEATAYYTNDAQDALDTARAIHKDLIAKAESEAGWDPNP